MTGDGSQAGTSTLLALQFGDSFLPAGSFTTTYGLEALVEADDITGAADLRAVLETYLHAQVGPCEMVALRAAHDAAVAGDLDTVVAVDEQLQAVYLPAEFRESSTRTGSQLCSLVAETEDDSLLIGYDETIEGGEAPGNYAIVLGVVGACTGMTARETAFVLGYSFVTDLLAAAQRLLRIGHTAVQRILTDLRAEIVIAWERFEDRSLEEMTPFAPVVDVAAAEHERADRRLFIS